MINSWWTKISNLGITESTPDYEKRNYNLANKLNFLLFASSLILTIATSIFRAINGNEFSIHTKKILVLAALTLINLFLSYKEKNNIVRFNLVVFPIFIVIAGPILLGYVQEMDVFIAPLAILCLSLIPITILFPDFKNWVFIFSFVYYFIHVFFLDNALNHFSGYSIVTFEYIPNFQFYFKIIFTSVFLFIYLILYYYRRQNYLFEKEISSINKELMDNIRELKATQEQLIQTEKMASLGILTAGVAHEINNPLNFIMGAYEGLKIHHEEASCCVHQNTVGTLLKNLKTGVDKASGIVDGLRQFSRDSDIYNEECNIKNIIDNCLKMLSNQIKDRINVEKKYNDEGLFIEGNVGKLHQVFMNILSNASDAIDNKGEIVINTNQINNSLVIEIIDNGEGISKENLNKIADPFFTTKAPGKGTGLGLSISYKIVQKHKGTIEFESEESKGTLVRITLPIKHKE